MLKLANYAIGVYIYITIELLSQNASCGQVFNVFQNKRENMLLILCKHKIYEIYIVCARNLHQSVTYYLS